MSAPPLRQARSAGAGRLRATVALVAVLLAIGAAVLPASGAPAETPGSSKAAVRRVLVVSIPGLGFDDLTPRAMPTLAALADRGATAALSVKTIGRRTDRADGYATIGAGARATAPNTPRTSGREADAGTPTRVIAVTGLPLVVADNANHHQGAVIGALGTALAAHGWITAVVANHDSPDHRDRVAALAVVRPTRRGRLGIVDAGSVSRELTAAPPGGLRRTDGDAVAAALDELPDRRVATVVEIGDVAWAQDGGAGRAARRAAVARADRVLARASAGLGPDDVVMVLAPSAPSGREQPTPFVLVGPGVEHGWATSATTRRAGSVTLPDIAPTILHAAGIATPSSMSGTPITSAGSGRSGPERIARLRADIAEVRFVDRATGVFLVTLPIVFASWSLVALLAAVLPLGRFRPFARGLVRWVGLSLAVVPIVTYLLGAISVRTWGQPAWSGAAWSLAALLAAIAWCLRPPERGVLAVAGLIWGVLVGDLVLGGALQYGTVLGNSPTVAGRFSGIGNNAFGLLAASTLILAVAAWHAVERRRPGGPALAAAGAVFAVAIVVDGAPGLGSDVGGVLTLAPVAALTLWSLSGRRVSWPRALLAALGTVAVLALLTAADLARPESSQTHLGRLARRLTDGGGGDVFVRKAMAALNSFRDSSLVWIPICVVLLAGLLWAFGRPMLREALAVPQARTLVPGAVALGVLGAALNDSGVMVPAMMATVFVPAAVHLLLSPGWPASRRGTDGAPPQPPANSQPPTSSGDA